MLPHPLDPVLSYYIYNATSVLKVSKPLDSSMSVSQSEKTDLASGKKVADILEAAQTLQDNDDFPDGGLRAWLVVLGCFIITAVAVGLR